MPFTWDARCLRAYTAQQHVLTAAFNLADEGTPSGPVLPLLRTRVGNIICRLLIEILPYRRFHDQKIHLDKDGTISGADAAKFFPASGLPSEALSRVWRGSCINGVTLDLEAFKRALLLVADEMDAAANAAYVNPFLDADSGSRPSVAPPAPRPAPSPASAATKSAMPSLLQSEDAEERAMTYNPYTGAPPPSLPVEAKAPTASAAPKASKLPSAPTVALPSLSGMFGSTSKSKTPSGTIPRFDGTDDAAASTTAATPSYGSRDESREQRARDGSPTAAPATAEEEHDEPEKGDAQKSGILGSISGAYGRYKERAAERKVQAKITKHCGADVTPPDTIIDCLHRLNHLWLAGYKYEHEKIGKQLTSKLLENKYITLGNVLHISNALKDTARSSGGGGESFFAKGLDKVRKGLLSGVKTHPDRDKLLKSLVWSFVSLLKNKATYPVQSTLQSCVHTFIAQNANDPDKAVKGLYVFAVKVQEKAAKAEEKRKKQLAAQEAKALKEKERLARQQQERERAMQADKS